jgi:hypothetical protein
LKKIKYYNFSKKNEGFKLMIQIVKALIGDNSVTLPQDLSPSMSTDLKNAPITSVDVE